MYFKCFPLKKKESYVTNASPFSLQEPGIGLMLVFSALQFVVGNLLIILIESKVWTKFDMKKCFRKSAQIDTSNVSNTFSILRTKQDLIYLFYCI